MSNANLETVRFALELLRRIPRNYRVTAAQLREQLAQIGIFRDVRTIQRMLAMLCEPFGIERDGSKPIGYRWKERSCGLTMVTMSEQEALLVMLARQHLAALLPPSVMSAMEPFFEQARRVLDPFGDERLATQWLSKVRVIGESLKLLPPTVQPGVLETVTQALYANQWLNVRYCDTKGRVSDKKVMPLGLAQQGPRPYLVCRYEPGGGERTLALYRMQTAEGTTLGFERPTDFDFETFDAEGRLAFGTGQHVKLSFTIDRDPGSHLRDTPLSEDQTLVEDGDVYRVTATVPDSLFLKRWLLSFGDELRDVRKEPVEKPAASKPGRRGRKGGAGSA